MAWQGIASHALSDNGAWFGYRLTSLEGDGVVVFRQTHGNTAFRFDLGEPPVPAYGQRPAGSGAGSLGFSSDGNFGAYLAYPTHADAQKLKRQHKPLEDHAGVVDLATGKQVEFMRVKRFAFSGDNPDWIAVQLLPPAAEEASHEDASERPEADPRGSDLILRQLATGKEINIGNVGEFAFDRQGRYLAWTVAAANRTGDGIEVRNLATGVVRVLDSDSAAVYRGLDWNHAGTALAALKGTVNPAWLDKAYTVLGFDDFGAGTASEVTFAPAQAPGFPAGMTISPDFTPAWTEDGSALLFGIHTPRPKPAHEADVIPDLELWNYQDPRLQSEQIKEEGRDRNYSYECEYRVAGHQFIRLADDALRTLTVAPHQRYAIGLDDRAYEMQGHLDGQTYDDIYVVDLATGQRRLAVRHARWRDQPAPDGVHFAFFRDGNYWVYDMSRGVSTNVTAAVPTSFVNTEDDHNLKLPPVPMLGWSRDSRWLLLSDNWDIWKVPVAGGTAVNLTADGKRDAIRYRRPVNFEQAWDPTARGFDLSQPLYLNAYGEWTKKDGIAVITPDKPGARRIQFDDAYYGAPIKAKDAPVYLFTRETWQDPPDYYAAGSGLANPVRITDLGAQQRPFLWTSGTVLVNYLGYKGDHLQAALHLPPNYVRGTQVPMVVEFYEKMSQNAYQYQRPTANGFSIGLYLSDGYAVLDPDITYKLNEPGMSAAGCLINAVKAAIVTGIPDPRHIGIHGHSWGGYQTAFTITQTNLFAAAAAGAPLTDMISMYGVIYKNTGVTNGQIFEASQGRFTGPPWELWQAYTRNSPVAHVANVQTPLLMLSDFNDGAVDFTQGMEYFNALRRMHKPVVLLDYPSQNHSLSKRVDQKDYTIRMMQFFNHYLKGGPMPAWYAHGVPALGMHSYLEHFNENSLAAGAGGGARPMKH